MSLHLSILNIFLLVLSNICDSTLKVLLKKIAMFVRWFGITVTTFGFKNRKPWCTTYNQIYLQMQHWCILHVLTVLYSSFQRRYWIYTIILKIDKLLLEQRINSYKVGIIFDTYHIMRVKWTSWGVPLLKEFSLTWNVLSQSRCNPRMPAYTSLEGAFHFNFTLLSPPGWKFSIH